MVQVSLIILLYNSKPFLDSCLTSILQFHKVLLETKEMEVILVDNASNDGSYEQSVAWKKKHKNLQITVHRLSENKGFAAGCNNAATFASGKYLVFLNPDTYFIDSSLPSMISFLKEKKDAGVVGGRLENVQHQVERSAGDFYSVRNIFLVLLGLERFGLVRRTYNWPTQVSWVSGGFLSVKKETFMKVNGFDEKYFMYLEDMDFCYSVKKKGLNTYYYPKSRIIHKEHGSASRSFAIFHIYQSLLYFFHKHYDYWIYISVRAMLIAKAYLLFLLGKGIGNSYLVETYGNIIKTY